MKHIALTFLMIMGFLEISCPAMDNITFYSLSTDPELQTFTEPYPGQRTQWLKSALPIPETSGGSFIFEFDLDIATFNHYASLMIALDKTNTQCLEFLFNKGDDRINRCYLRVQAAPGVVEECKPFENVTPGKMRACIEYDAAARTALFSLSSADGKELFSSGRIRINGRISLNRIVIGVTQCDNKVSEISYDPSVAALFCRSHVGIEGAYPYSIEAFIDNLAINFIPPAE